MRRALLPLLAVAVITVAGCGGSGTPEPTTDPPTLSASAAPTSAPSRPAASGRAPSDVLDLRDWKLTLPTGSAQEEKDLVGYTAPPYFALSADRAGVVFRCPVGGSTTSGSSYPRTELREMDGTSEAAWSSTEGTHTLTATVAITHLPVAKPQVVVGQVHDDSDDVVEIVATGTGNDTYRLGYRWKGSEQKPALLDAQPLGRPFTYTISVTDGTFSISVDGEPAATERMDTSGLYFKAGMYVQSNPSKGDLPTAYGEAVFTALTIRHS